MPEPPVAQLYSSQMQFLIFKETGRAGRDNLTSHCILYYTYSDSIRMAKIFSMEQIPRDILELHEENLKRVVQYAENRIDCRRAMILNYFGENFDPSECKKNKQTTCDNCVSHVIFIHFFF